MKTAATSRLVDAVSSQLIFQHFFRKVFMLSVAVKR